MSDNDIDIDFETGEIITAQKEYMTSFSLPVETPFGWACITHWVVTTQRFLAGATIRIRHKDHVGSATVGTCIPYHTLKTTPYLWEE